MDRGAGFDDWYAATRPTLVRSLVVASGGDVHAATDAADEAMVRALERWPRVRAMTSSEAWTYRVGLNVVRRRHRRRQTETRAIDTLTAGRDTHVPGIDGDLLALRDAVADLDRRTREVIALRYVAGLTEPEIADLLGTKPGTVSSLLSRARTDLRRRLEDDR
ncbi:MAG: RNA polymerase sigma factor, partial [Acidimicrobiales bacterium]